MKERVKICGITRLEDALEAERLGASAVGFIFFRNSKRYITPDHAGEISTRLGPFIARVGVFVDEDITRVDDIAVRARLTAVQLHGSEDPGYAERLRKRGLWIIKAFRVGPDFTQDLLKAYTTDAFLLDSGDSEGTYGGTGKSFEWNRAAGCEQYGKIILAGGLSAGNVREAVAMVKPWAVDVSSGVEVSPGIKDAQKMRSFFTALNA